MLELVKKASCRLYLLRQLKRSQVTPEELILFYITCIRSNLEYAFPVFHRDLPGYLSEDLERLQKRALRIIYPGMSYNQALEFSGLPTLFKRRELFNAVVGAPGHTLHKLLPPKNPANYFLRRNRDFALPLCKAFTLFIDRDLWRVPQTMLIDGRLAAWRITGAIAGS